MEVGNTGKLPDLPPEPFSEKPSGKLSYSVKNGFLLIGEKTFRVTSKSCGAISNDIILDKLGKLLTSQLDLKEQVTADSKEKLKISITDKGVFVSRGAGLEKAVDVNPGEIDAYKKKSDTIIHALSSQEAHVAALTRMLSSRFHSTAVRDAVKNILDEEPNSCDGMLSWQENTLAHILQGYANSPLRAALQQLPSSYAEKKGRSKNHSVASCEKEIRRYILENIVRVPKEIKDGDGRSFVQQICRTDTLGGPFEANRGHSSSNDRYEDAAKVGNPNLGSVVEIEGGSRKKCVVTRSGRSNSSERLQELVRFSAIEQASTREPMGLTPVPGKENEYEFTHHITSYLDASSLKAAGSLPQKIAGWFSRKIGVPGNEKSFLAAILKGVDDWKDETIVAKDANGKDITIHLKKPLLSNEPFSNIVAGAYIGPFRIPSTGYAFRDRLGFVNGLKLLQRAIDEKKLLGPMPQMSEKLKKLFADMKYQDLLSSSSPISRAFSSSDMRAFRKEIALFLSEQAVDQKNNLAQAFYATIFRKEPHKGLSDVSDPGFVPDAMHSSDVEVYRNYLFTRLNISSSKQCKSGKDRTAIGVALALAAHRFYEQEKRAFIPKPPVSQKDVLLFKCFYCQGLIDLGLAITTETAGYPGLKLLGGVAPFQQVGNPAAMRYLLNQGDLQSPDFDAVWSRCFPHVPKPLEAFVEMDDPDFNSQDRSKQYSGRFTDSYLLGGKVQGENKARKLLDSVTLQQKNEAQAYIAQKLPNGKFQFDKNLNLKTAISLCGLDEGARKTLDEEWKLLSQKRDLLLKDEANRKNLVMVQLKLYLVGQLKWLDERYREGKELVKKSEDWNKGWSRTLDSGINEIVVE